MCGKANPADLDECRYCQARLRPFWDTASDSSLGASPEDQATDLPEWLRSLRGPEDQESLPLPPEREAQSALPDWLSQLRDQPGLAEEPQAEDVSDDLIGETGDSPSSWLQDFLSEAEPTAEATLSDQREDAYQQDEAGWISRIGSTQIQEEQPLEASKTLDWLSELEQPADDLGPVVEQEWPSKSAPFSIESEEPVPDWLQPAASGPSEALEPVDDSEPEWAKLRPAQSPDLQWVDDESLNWLDEEDEDLPAWLFDKAPTDDTAEPAEAALEDQEIQPVEVAPEQELIPEFEEALPDQIEPALEMQGEPSAPVGEALAMAGLLAGEPQVDEKPAAPEAAEIETPEEEAALLAGAAIAAIGLDAARDAVQDQDELGWLGELEDSFGDLSLNATAESMSAPLEGEQGFGQGAGGTLPVWLTKAREAEEQEQAESVEEQAELKPSELPSWLQAMRPVGLVAAGNALASEKEPLQVEGAGPLAGLRGALPAEPDVSHVQKPPVYSIKMQVSDTQQLQAELLRGLVEGEGQPQALRGRPAISSQEFIRLFIAVLLIFPLLFAVLTGTPQFDLPAPSPEVDAAGKQIDALPAGAPVLLAVDYQPGFSGEMDAVAVPVVQQLFERGAYLALVSTLSTGPAQAEHLLAQARSASGASLQSQANSTNLGYIPGGATGLLAFAQAPRDTLPTNLRGEAAWAAGSLQGVDMLDQFALVIVATENPDIARYWIEQVQPQLGTTPLVMLLSAQVEPMVWPYYHANPAQVQGMVSGLAGAAAYQVRSVQAGAATQYWSPYSLGVWIAALLMMLGGIAYLALAQIARQKEKAGGEKRP
jgi:hypothetical protein